jgi:hypothetical protein
MKFGYVGGRYVYFLTTNTLEFDGNPPRHEKILHLPSTKHEDPFHVNKKTFEIFMKQSSVRCGVFVTIVFHSSQLSFRLLLSKETLLATHVAPLLIERHAYTQD